MINYPKNILWNALLKTYVLLVCNLFSLSGCSAITNTIAGLTTPQSTISGSNYVYFVDSKSQNLLRTPELLLPGDLIQEGDNFKITLDFGFLRYLQAVDPYVIVFSEAWMGPAVKPTDSNLVLRQVVLNKDGVTQNANLPISFQSLLGPVTLGEGNHDVHVTLKVVVLSKADNEQTIQLINGLAAAASTAAPMYGPAAGALAELGATVVAQNKDKIEFEHTFTLSPKTFEFFTDSNQKLTQAALRQGKIVVVKGESEARVVPYQHPGYYFLPFNWAGNRVDHNSRRFESKRREVEANWYNFGWHLVRIPFDALSSLFVPSEWYFDDYKGLDPTDLKVDGNSLVCKQFFEPPPIETSFLGISYQPYKLDMCTDWPKYPYSQKTFMVFNVEKSEGTYGSFSELITKFSEHGEMINALTTSNSEARKFSDDQLKRAFESIQKAVTFERAKQNIHQRARKGDFNTEDDIKNLDVEPEEKKLLVQRTVDARVRASVSEYTHFVELQRDRIRKQMMQSALNEKMRTEPTGEIKKNVEDKLKGEGVRDAEIEQAKKEAVAAKIEAEVNEEKALEGSYLDQIIPRLIAYMGQTRWDNIGIKKSDHPDLWKQGWERVLTNVRKWLISIDPAEALKAFEANLKEWEKLQDLASTMPSSVAKKE